MLDTTHFADFALVSWSDLRWPFVAKVRWLRLVCFLFSTYIFFMLLALLPVFLHPVFKIIPRFIGKS